MSYSEDLLHWYKFCGHEISLFQSNKNNGYVGVAICKDTQTSYTASGNDKFEVLHDLKNMLNGTYYK